MNRSFIKLRSTIANPPALIRLTRIHRPIGIYLVLWPMLWSLWLAAGGAPGVKNLVIFILGCILMRSAGCVINDFADRKVDGFVHRTHDRPLATGEVSALEALSLFAVLCFLAFLLVLFTNGLTILLSFGALGLAAVYPFAKRFTQLPQVVLGAAFAWAVPMAFAAELEQLPRGAWLIYIAVVLWTVCYDTFYAMVDRDDDIKIGIKSTAILFGELDRAMTAILQILTILTLILVGTHFKLSWVYYTSLTVASLLFVYQQYLIRHRDKAACFQAFLNNNWVGMVIFVGIVLHYALYAGSS